MPVEILAQTRCKSRVHRCCPRCSGWHSTNSPAVASELPVAGLSVAGLSAVAVTLGAGLETVAEDSDGTGAGITMAEPVSAGGVDDVGTLLLGSEDERTQAPKNNSAGRTRRTAVIKTFLLYISNLPIIVRKRNPASWHSRRPSNDPIRANRRRTLRL
jgi:hypothetical protein